MIGAFMMLSNAVTAKTLTIERIFDSPSLDGNAPRNLKVSPDGQRVTFLKGKASDYEQLDLWEYHIESGKTRMLFDSAELAAEDGDHSPGSQSAMAPGAQFSR